MAEMNHPFQCIEVVKKQPTDELGGRSYLLAACGPKLVCLDINRGEIVSQWTADPAAKGSHIPTDVKCDDNESELRPAKKQKTSPNQSHSSNIIKLTITPDYEQAVVVTDDKCLRVFEITLHGELTELSQRFMPKRPCAVQVLPDNTTIFCGDKFGDVYSLPLLPQEPGLAQEDSTIVDVTQRPSEPSGSFKPSANNLTVHTRRNLKSLEAQLKQKNTTPKTKEPLKFEHKLLLGHVSMLTDLCYAMQTIDGKERGYIITADRDEHIRISRGPPQSHVIEGYCLGHTEFVSKSLVIPGTNLMISGGGDEWLGVWEWPSFKLRRKIHDFKTRVREKEHYPPTIPPNSNPCPVSGMWLVRGTIGGILQGIVAVACEKSSIISWFPISELMMPANETDIFWGRENMGAPVLDIAQIGDKILVSRYESDTKLDRVTALCADFGSTAICTLKDADVDWVKRIHPLQEITSPVTSEEILNEFLYTVESLRKRTYKDREEEAEE